MYIATALSARSIKPLKGSGFDVGGLCAPLEADLPGEVNFGVMVVLQSKPEENPRAASAWLRNHETNEIIRPEQVHAGTFGITLVTFRVHLKTAAPVRMVTLHVHAHLNGVEVAPGLVTFPVTDSSGPPPPESR